MTVATRIFDDLTALADPIRCRLLLLLERHELTVSELCQVLQLPQSTVSRHLKTLSDERWVAARADGASRRYRLADDETGSPARRLWHVVREQTASLVASQQDIERVAQVLAQRRTRAQEFFSSAAGHWDRVRTDLFGARSDLMALLGLLDEQWTVGDLGCGTGHVTEALAPFVAQVVAVDESAAMLSAARKRLAGLQNVDVRAGELDALPIADGALDAAVLFLVLPYVAEPVRALAEAARVLRPGGRLLVVDLLPHDREEFRHEMGHLRMGIEGAELGAWCAAAGLGGLRVRALPPDPQAKGPMLFAGSCRKSGTTES